MKTILVIVGVLFLTAACEIEEDVGVPQTHIGNDRWLAI